MRDVIFGTHYQPFRKLSCNEMPFSRTPLREGATDLRWVRLNRSTRAKAHSQGERPCYANLLSQLLLQLPSAPWRWLRPRRPRAAADGAAVSAATIIITGVMASASATSAAAMTSAT